MFLPAHQDHEVPLAVQGHRVKMDNQASSLIYEGQKGILGKDIL
jgi:hypothetical protein